MTDIDLKKEYDGLKKKYGLPDYDKLDNEFEFLYVGQIIEIKFPLKFIRRRINDKLAFFCSMLQGVLQPNPGSLVSLQESKFLEQKDLEKTMNLLKELMFVERQSLLLDISYSEKEEAEFVKDVFKKWPEIKESVSDLFQKIKDGWKKEMKEKGAKNYFG